MSGSSPYPAQSDERRADVRTNLFLAASIATEQQRLNVRVRNISPSGALIEGCDLPAVGEWVRLRRGSLAADAQIVRRDAKQAGIRFDRPTDPADWLPTGDGGQQRVDRVVHQVRDLFPNAQPSAAYLASQMRAGASGPELNELADMIDDLADELAVDTHVVGRYLGKLQVLDMAAQKLRSLAKGVG